MTEGFWRVFTNFLASRKRRPGFHQILPGKKQLFPAKIPIIYRWPVRGSGGAFFHFSEVLPPCPEPFQQGVHPCKTRKYLLITASFPHFPQTYSQVFSTALFQTFYFPPIDIKLSSFFHICPIFLQFVIFTTLLSFVHFFSGQRSVISYQLSVWNAKSEILSQGADSCPCWPVQASNTVKCVGNTRNFQVSP